MLNFIYGNEVGLNEFTKQKQQKIQIKLQLLVKV